MLKYELQHLCNQLHNQIVCVKTQTFELLQLSVTYVCTEIETHNSNLCNQTIAQLRTASLHLALQSHILEHWTAISLEVSMPEYIIAVINAKCCVTKYWYFD